jgi:hypothetical protein
VVDGYETCISRAETELTDRAWVVGVVDLHKAVLSVKF